MEKENKTDRQSGLYFEAGLAQAKEKQAFEPRAALFLEKYVLSCSSVFIPNQRPSAATPLHRRAE